MSALRQAWREIARNPLYRLLCTATLGVGIGVCAPYLATHHDLEELVENGQWPRALALAEQRLKTGGPAADARLYWLAGRVRFAYGELDQAAQLTEKAAELDPKNPDVQFRLFEIYGSQAQQASLFRQPGLARKAKKAVDTALALDPRHIEALAGSMMYLYRAPSLFGGDRQRALAIPTEIGKIAPARGYMAQSALDLFEKRDDQVLENYRKAVAADPKLYNARARLARLLISGATLDVGQAELHAREAVRINNQRVSGWETLAYALGRQGKLAELDRTLSDMAKALPDEPSGSFYGARGLLDGKKDTGKAEAMLRQYAKQPARGPERPPAAVAHLILARALEQQGRNAEARAELEAGAKLDPKYEPIQKELKRLRG